MQKVSQKKEFLKDNELAYFDQLVLGISQCQHKAEELRPGSGVPASTIKQITESQSHRHPRVPSIWVGEIFCA